MDKILIVDDEAAVRFGLRDFLQSNGYEVCEASGCQEAEKACLDLLPDFAIVDYMLADGNALELMPRLKAIVPGLLVIILTGHGTIDLAVRAIQEGAEHFLTKPVELPALLTVVRRLLENQRNRRKQLANKARLRTRAVDPFLGTSAAIRRLAEQAQKVVATTSPILIQGETGTGKGLLAAWMHDNGPRSEEAFVDLNCAGLSRDFLESELFGHERGAFTGAIASKAGLLEVAHRGTILLDEIGDVDPQVQPKLLKVLEEKRFRRLGDVHDRQVDIHLIAATHQDLGALVRHKRFRSDLYFRISTIPLCVPALRERVEDIAVIAEHFLRRLGAELAGGTDVALSPQARKALESYRWPGNIRELRNVLERALLLSETHILRREDLLFAWPAPADPLSTDPNMTLKELERRHIEFVLRAENGHVENTAKRLGVPRSPLYQKIKRHRIALSKI